MRKALGHSKIEGGAGPSDLTRTDWVEYEAGDEARFRHKLGQALDEIDAIAVYTEMLLEIALEAPTMDCAIAFERASKAFLLTKEERFLGSAELIAARLQKAAKGDPIADLERVHGEVVMFVRQGRRAPRAAG